MDLVGSPAALRGWSIASLVANMGLVVTGGLVRVTGSGLGCSTWPQCEPGSYVPHGDAPLHTYIEFGNRLLTFVLVAVAIGTLIAAWRARDAAGNPVRRVRVLALLAAAGIPAQAVIGGISVLARLEWWVRNAEGIALERYDLLKTLREIRDPRPSMEWQAKIIDAAIERNSPNKVI